MPAALPPGYVTIVQRMKSTGNHGLRSKFNKILLGINHYCITILPSLQSVATLRTKVRELMA